MESNKEKLLTVLKENKIYLLIAIVFIAIIGFCISISYVKNKEPLPKPVDLANSTKDNEYSTMYVQYLTEPFATRNNEECRFAIDQNNIIYIIELSQNDLNRLEQIKEYTYSDDDTLSMPAPVQIFGRTQEITPDLKKIAIESYNEIYDEQTVNESNFENYLGTVYLNTKLPPRDNSTEMSVEVISFLFAVSFLSKYIRCRTKTEKALKEYISNGTLDYIYNQLNDVDTIEYIKGRLYLTKDYIIDISDGLSIIKYDDIAWIYPCRITQYGMTKNTYIEVVKHDKQKIKISEFKGSKTKKKEEIFTKIYRDICGRLPNALKGYTDANNNFQKGL